MYEFLKTVQTKAENKVRNKPKNSSNIRLRLLFDMTAPPHLLFVIKISGQSDHGHRKEEDRRELQP